MRADSDASGGVFCSANERVLTADPGDGMILASGVTSFDGTVTIGCKRVYGSDRIWWRK